MFYLCSLVLYRRTIVFITSISFILIVLLSFSFLALKVTLVFFFFKAIISLLKSKSVLLSSLYNASIYKRSNIKLKDRAILLLLFK